jgi:hypothetical protein
MTLEEGLTLIREKEGEVCGRLTRRRDGTVLSADCPVGWAARVRQLRRRCVCGAVAGLLLLFSFLGLSRLRGTTDSGQAAVPVLEQLDEWMDDLRIWAGLAPKRRPFLAGQLCLPPGDNAAGKE